jgi:DNA N-6-adenine-methyltransferase (Dam)
MTKKTGLQIDLSGKTAITKSKANDSFRTPEWILDLLFEGIEYFDPCPLNLNPEKDGLSIAWPTNKPIFINPPWSNPRPWVEKAIAHKGEVVMLLPMGTEAAWWGYREFFKVTIIWDRLKFTGGVDGNPVVARTACMVWKKGAKLD